MTDKAFSALYDAARSAPERSAYVNANAAAVIGSTPDYTAAEQLGRLWDTLHLPFDRLLHSLGLSATELSTRYCIPYRTVQSWTLGERAAAPYLRLLIAEATGWLTIRGMN